MPDQPQDPQALLSKLVHCLATPTASTVGNYFDAEQQLNEYCAANGFIWAFDDHGVPYMEKANDLARRIVQGIAELVSREGVMTPVTTTLEDVTGVIAYLIKAAPCRHDFFIWIGTEDWRYGTAYCEAQDCGAGYSLVFGDDGELVGVEPFGR